MGEVIRLGDARKRLKRAEAEKAAAANRAKFGVKKAERRKVEAEEALAARRLDAARLGEDRERE